MLWWARREPCGHQLTVAVRWTWVRSTQLPACVHVDDKSFLSVVITYKHPRIPVELTGHTRPPPSVNAALSSLVYLRLAAVVGARHAPLKDLKWLHQRDAQQMYTLLSTRTPSPPSPPTTTTNSHQHPPTATHHPPPAQAATNIFLTWGANIVCRLTLQVLRLENKVLAIKPINQRQQQHLPPSARTTPTPPPQPCLYPNPHLHPNSPGGPLSHCRLAGDTHTL